MRGRLATIVMTFGAVALVMSTMGEATPAYIWNASNERSDRSLPVAAGRQACGHRTRRRPATRTACDLSRSERLSADRRSHAQAGAGASWTNGLQGRAYHFGRCDRNGRRKSARWSWEAATGLAGMPRRWRGRALSHELAIGRLSGRPLFWACPSLVRHWQGPACVDQRGVIVIILPEKSAIPLFDRSQHHSSVPAKFATAVARSGGPGRPRGRRERALLWTAASTMAGFRVLRVATCISVVCDDRVAIRRPGGCQVDRSGSAFAEHISCRILCSLHSRGVPKICDSRALDSRSDAA